MAGPGINGFNVCDTYSNNTFVGRKRIFTAVGIV